MIIFSILTFTFIIACSVVSFDLHSKKENKSTLPSWVIYVYPIFIGLAITILIINWKYAILILIICYILGTILPVLDKVGNIVMSPFIPKNHSINSTYLKNKTLVFFGIGTYILSILSYAVDLDGNYVAPTILILLSALATIIFTIMAVIRLWKTRKIISIVLLITATITLIYTIPAVRGLNTIIFVWVLIILWKMSKKDDQIKKIQEKLGFTTEDVSTILDEKQKGNDNEVEKIIISAQERAKMMFKETTGIDAEDIIPEIGVEIEWTDIIDHTFHVLEFDKNNTTVGHDNRVIAKNSLQPYGYLLAESPILNNKVSIPIIHQDDFLLTTSVFDEPQLVETIASKELLVTYSPKNFSSSPHHVLHYVIVPSGTLDSYYSKNNYIHMAKPEPQKLFEPFVYKGEIKVQINPEPKL